MSSFFSEIDCRDDICQITSQIICLGNSSLNTYIPWLKVGKIHAISTSQSSLYERSLKTSGIHTILELTIITSTMLQATSNQF